MDSCSSWKGLRTSALQELMRKGRNKFYTRISRGSNSRGVTQKVRWLAYRPGRTPVGCGRVCGLVFNRMALVQWCSGYVSFLAEHQ